MKVNLKNKIEATLLKLNEIVSLTPPILDYPKYVTKRKMNKKKTNKNLKKLENLVKELKNDEKAKHKEFVMNQLQSLITFLKNYERMKFEETLKVIFGVEKIANIDYIIKRWEKDVSKRLEVLGMSFEEWQKSWIVNLLDKKQTRYFYYSVIENLKSHTVKKFRIENVRFKLPIIIKKPIGVYWYFFVNKPTLIVDTLPQNFYLIKRKVSHETFPGHHFIESLRRKYYGEVLPRYKIIYSPLASFEEGLSECLFEIVFPLKFDILSEIAHSIILLKYAYCYKAVESTFDKNEIPSRTYFYKCKYLDKNEITKLVKFVRFNKIYAALYTPSYLFIKKICEEKFSFNPLKIKNFLLSKPMDMFILRNKYL